MPLTIVGHADEEEGEQREEEEPLLAPMPRPRAVVQVGAQAGAARGNSLAPWLVAALAVLAAVAGLTIVARRRAAGAIE